MIDTQSLHGACTPPFLQSSNFQSTKGCRSLYLEFKQLCADTYLDIPGRFCAQVPSFNGTIECCLPCPLTEWVYPERKEMLLVFGEYS